LAQRAMQACAVVLVEPAGTGGGACGRTNGRRASTFSGLGGGADELALRRNDWAVIWSSWSRWARAGSTSAAALCTNQRQGKAMRLSESVGSRLIPGADRERASSVPVQMWQAPTKGMSSHAAISRR
jgi:hypothetical protein